MISRSFMISSIRYVHDFPQSGSLNFVCVNSKKNVKSRVETHVSIRAEKSQINRGSLILGEKKIFDMLTVRHLNTGIFKVFYMLYVHEEIFTRVFSSNSQEGHISCLCKMFNWRSTSHSPHF